MDKLGVDNLKKAILAVIKLAEKIDKNLADDGKITLWEALGIGGASVGDLVFVIKNASIIDDEFADLDEQEREEVLSFIKSEFDLQNDKLESIIETSLVIIMQLNELIHIIRK